MFKNRYDREIAVSGNHVCEVIDAGKHVLVTTVLFRGGGGGLVLCLPYLLRRHVKQTKTVT